MNFALLRGLGRESRHWANFIPIAQSYFPDANFITFDIPGAGRNAHLSSPANVVDMASFLQDELKSLDGMTGEWHLISISLGGMIGLQWCHQFPGTFKSLTVINSSLAKVSPFNQRILPHSLLKILDILFTDEHLLREQKIIQLTSSHYDINQKWAKKYSQFYLDAPIKRVNALKQLFTAFRFSPPSLQTPLLVLNSWADKLVAPECSIALANYYKAPVLTHPTSGHDIPMDAPHWICQNLKKFLMDLKSSRRQLNQPPPP